MSSDEPEDKAEVSLFPTKQSLDTVIRQGFRSYEDELVRLGVEYNRLIDAYVRDFTLPATKKPVVLVFVSGKTRSGKDTLADHLVEQYSFEKLAFASALKHAVQHMFSFDDDQVFGERKDMLDASLQVKPRRVLIDLGTAILRNLFARKLWVFAMLRHIEKHAHRQQRWVVPDLRFQNEMGCLRHLQSKYKDNEKLRIFTVRVKRKDRGKIDDSVAQNQSETDLDAIASDAWDLVVRNNSTRSALYTRVDKFMREQGVSGKDSVLKMLAQIVFYAILLYSVLHAARYNSRRI